MSISIETYALSRKYTDGSISGITGTLAGKNCTIQSITEIEGGNRVTFEWTDNGGTTRTSVLDVMDGKGIQSIAVNENNHLIITYSDGTTGDAGEIEITAAVNSVNEKTGDVVLTADDLSAYTKTETDDKIETEIGKLDVTDTAVEGSYVTEVSETDGKIAVTREASDSTPTENSKKMIQSGGVYTALAGKQDTLTFDDIPTDASDNPVKSNGVYDAIQDVYEVNGVTGAKNLLKNTAVTQTRNEVTFTINDDGSFVVNGTASSLISFDINTSVRTNGDVIFSMGQTGGSDFRVFITANDGSGDIASTGTSDSVQFNTDKDYFVHLIIYSGKTLNNLVFKPMLRLATDTDDTYVPYAETNYQLTHNKVDWKTNGVLGAKNLLQNKGTTSTINGVTFTVNDDGSVTTSGTSESAVWFPLLGGTDTIAFLNSLESDKSYILSGVPDSADSDISITIWNYGEVARAHANDDKEFRKPSPVSTNSSNISIGTDATGVSFDGLTFYPMIRFADDTDDTYRPYAKTNKQLTDLIGDGGISEEEVTVASESWVEESYTATTGTFYSYKYSVAIADLTTSSWVDVDISSGSYTNNYAIESTNGYVVIRTVSQPSVSLTFRIFYKL